MLIYNDMNMYDSHTFLSSEIDLFYDINMIILCINEHEYWIPSVVIH